MGVSTHFIFLFLFLAAVLSSPVEKTKAKQYSHFKKSISLCQGKECYGAVPNPGVFQNYQPEIEDQILDYPLRQDMPYLEARGETELASSTVDVKDTGTTSMGESSCLPGATSTLAEDQKSSSTEYGAESTDPFKETSTQESSVEEWASSTSESTSSSLQSSASTQKFSMLTEKSSTLLEESVSATEATSEKEHSVTTLSSDYSTEDNTTTVAPSSTTEQLSTLTSPSSTTMSSLPYPPSESCVKQYRDASSGMILGPGIGNYTFPARPTSFVTRKGTTLVLDGKDYTMVGPNIFWLGLDGSNMKSIQYPSHGRIREALAMSVAMGSNTVRSHTLGISTKTLLSIWPSARNTNEQAFEPIDYTIFAARAYGLRLLIPLTDAHQYYHGGQLDFNEWAGFGRGSRSQFFTQEKIISMFEDYITAVLSHVNSYTGVALKDDPTIIGWETGNELGGYLLEWGAPPKAWTERIATHIKSLAPNHLVFDGTNGFFQTPDGLFKTTAFEVSQVDVVTDHFYPLSTWLLQKNFQWISNQNNKKAFFAGELDWTSKTAGSASLASFLTSSQALPSMGLFFWSLFGHDDQCCNWNKHNDGYAYYYPDGDSLATSNADSLLEMIKFFHTVRDAEPPSTFVAVACPQSDIME